ncbi:MAG TPA: class I SAM-dependent methyltransferase [Kofleriaceae bacterium]|nr:class I SAM-dependent methyltransferase [Kofleriaceae bacterium]
MRARRYQLRKSSVDVVASGHPWIFRRQLSSAAAVFADGEWLRLVDGQNQVVGHGMYEAQGAIAIRVLERGARVPDAAWAADKVAAALARRTALRDETDAFRAVHGENDGLPAVVVDVYRDTAVLSTYSAGADALGRLVAAQVCRRMDLARLLWKPAHRRAAAGPAALRALRGQVPAEPIEIREGPLVMRVDLAGQKSGAYLDLRGLRRWILAQEDLAGARVLNLFSYTGTLGLAARRAGAAEVWNVDSSRGALALAARFHGGGARDQVADVFEWLPRLDRAERFDLLIADPPPMTSRVAQVEGALAAYRRLYRAAAHHVVPGGRVVACCCTSRIDARSFQQAVVTGLGKGFRFERRIPPEVDHPVGFPEADYLKVLVFRAPGRAISQGS